MKLDEFLEKYNGAPWHLYEAAELAAEVDDNVMLSNRAKAYLQAKRDLEVAFEVVGYELG